MSRRVLRASLGLAMAMAMVCVFPPATLANDTSPQLTLRPFCQTQDGFVTYLAIHATGFPAGSEGTLSYILRRDTGNEFGDYPFETDERGEGQSSLGFGLSGLDDPLLGRSITLRVDVNGAVVEKTVTLGCDPDANAPVDRAECNVDVFRFFFAFLGYPFKNRGHCIAFVATNGKNGPAANR